MEGLLQLESKSLFIFAPMHLNEVQTLRLFSIQLNFFDLPSCNPPSPRNGAYYLDVQDSRRFRRWADTLGDYKSPCYCLASAVGSIWKEKSQ